MGSLCLQNILFQYHITTLFCILDRILWSLKKKESWRSDLTTKIKLIYSNFLFCVLFTCPVTEISATRAALTSLDFCLICCFHSILGSFYLDVLFSPLALLYSRTLGKLKIDNVSIKLRYPLKLLLRKVVYSSENAADIIYINVNYYWKRWGASFATSKMTLGFSKFSWEEEWEAQSVLINPMVQITRLWSFFSAGRHP